MRSKNEMIVIEEPFTKILPKKRKAIDKIESKLEAEK